MLSTTLRTLLSLMLISISLLFNSCHASDFGDPGNDSDTESSHTTSPRASVTRLADDHVSIARFTLDRQPSSHEVSLDDTATVPGDIDAAEGSALANGTFAHTPTPVVKIIRESAQSEEEKDGFVTVDKQAKFSPKLSLDGGMFDTLSLPKSTLPYTQITLTGCCCQMPLDSDSFQNNSALEVINLIYSQLNLRGLEEKFGEGCLNLTQINLKGTSDSSIAGYPQITPERFAQLAHPDVLQRILRGQCQLFISHPERSEDCYTLDEMKEKFLSSVLQLRSLQKAQETVSIYQSIIETLKASVDPYALANAGGRVLLTTCTAGIIKGS